MGWVLSVQEDDTFGYVGYVVGVVLVVRALISFVVGCGGRKETILCRHFARLNGVRGLPTPGEGVIELYPYGV
jgi:hypothetical protein